MKDARKTNILVYSVPFVILLGGIGFFNYLIFHAIVELSAIIIGGSLFFLSFARIKQRSIESFDFLAVAFGGVTIIDFFHTLTFKRMGIFSHITTDEPTQFWIIGRYFESIALLIFSLLLIGRIRKQYYKRLYIGVVVVTIMVSIFAPLSVLYFKNFPTCYVDGIGLTWFKIVSEYMIILILALAAFFIMKSKEASEYSFLRYALLFTILSEFMFTLYYDVYGIFNMLGHIFKFLSFLYIYMECFVKLINEPYIRQREYLDELYKKNEQIKVIGKNLPSGMIYQVAMKDNQRKFLYLSDNVQSIHGIKKEDILNDAAKLYASIHEDDIEQLKQGEEEAVRQMSSFNCEFRIRSSNGEYIWVNCVSTPRKIEDGWICFDGIEFIIDDRKKMEEELIKAKEKAEESDRLKTAFLHNMSHEIRTPMNAIMGFAGLMKDYYNDKAQLENFSGVISQSCNNLLDIINDILDISKIESGQLHAEPEECSLNELFDELTSSFNVYQKRIGKSHLKFSMHALCDPSDTIIITDKVKLKQIFANLLSNAFKFTDKGRVVGGCKYAGNKLVFYVSDTGIGIPADKQKIIFESFARLPQSPEKTIGGTGLGLSIVKGLVSFLGGEISLESEPNKGSTFSFTVPYKTVQPSNHVTNGYKKPNGKNLSDKTILIVEDDLYNLEYLKEILSRTGSNILQAENGKEAVEISKNQPIDLVLMDIGLPDMDGYE
ncbi:MAG TPA: MASE3 domain-containing protein, partial [Bacteroidales bacterium]